VTTGAETQQARATPAGTPGAGPGRRRIVVAVVAVAVVAAVAFAVKGRKGGGEAHAVARSVPHVEGELIKLPPEFAKRAGITTAPVERREVTPVALVPGTVQLDPQRTAAVGTRILGRVRRILKFEGDDVRAGDVLAEIESAELARAQSALLGARAREEATAADANREDRLAEARVSALRDAQAARAAAVSARAERLAAEQTVRSLGGDPDAKGELGIVTLRSPIAGRVIASRLTRGGAVEGTEAPFLVSDLSSVWVRLDVFERDLAAIRVGDPVEVARQVDLSRVARGKVARAGDVLNQQTHSAEVWIEVENADRWFRPGESVGARIRSRGDGATSLAVPTEALVSIDGKPTLFVAVGPDAVEIRQVTLGRAGEKHTAVLSGVREGEQVVVAGAFALKSEIFR
jgi:cobalt-zinc-cadmium efflux system membrane fusion protein